MEPSIPPRHPRTVAGLVIVKAAEESMSVQKSKGQSVVVWLLIAAIAAWEPCAENGLTVMKFS